MERVVRCRVRLAESLALCCLFCVIAGVTRAAEAVDHIDTTVAQFFRPFQRELATMSPDGRHVALTDEVRRGQASIIVVNLDDHSTRAYYVGARPAHTVLQMRWVSATQLVFTTNSRGVGLLDLNQPTVKALLVGGDLDTYEPGPVLGPRTLTGTVTPDMPAEANQGNPAFEQDRRKVTLSEALADASGAGDLFGHDSKRGAGSALRPFLLGAKPGSAKTVLIEVRSEADIFAYNRTEQIRLTVPGNLYLLEPGVPPPLSVADLRGEPGNFAEVAEYDVDYPPAPLVVLELDLADGRKREVAKGENWRRVWLDQQGRVRLALEQHNRRFRYQYRAADGKKWVPLDSIVKTATPLGFTVGAENLLGSRSVPLGFDAEARFLFIVSNVGRDTFSLRALDLAKGQLEPFEIRHDYFDVIEPTALSAPEVLRLDPPTGALMGVSFASARRQTHWLDGRLAALQTILEKSLAPQRVDIREWNAARTRLLIDTASPGDPGGFLVYDTAANKLIDCGQRAPWLAGDRRNPTEAFNFIGADGRRFSGYLTLPRQPRLTPSPVLVYFHDGPWYSDTPGFNRGAQALAALGFAVLQLNHRGSSGLGRQHLGAIDAGLDRTVLEDVRVVLAQISKTAPVNPRLVAALGHGIGGYLAVRMTQLAPETFRCAVAINALGDLDAWRTQSLRSPTLLTDLRRHYFAAEREKLRAQSALTAGRTTKAPVLVVHATEDRYVPLAMGHSLYRLLKDGAEETRFLELPKEGHGGWSEETTARLFAELGRFFNATIYNYRVELRQPAVVR